MDGRGQESGVVGGRRAQSMVSHGLFAYLGGPPSTPPNLDLFQVINMCAIRDLAAAHSPQT